VLDGTTADEVAKATGLRPAAVATTLAELELDGVVAEDGTGRWRRTTS
jgi:predicted Rossmann fold nucleotide-binding protein DprA/Smf involved in DNA uptake